MSHNEGPYARLARDGAYEPLLGKALISLVEPTPGKERAYNRWYEDDHAIITAHACPHIFAGKRWVATRRLRAMRIPLDSAVAKPVDQGCYLATYWILKNRYDDFLEWARSLVVNRLKPEGRMSPPRKHIFTNDQNYEGAVYRDARGPRDVHALHYPYAGLGMQVIDATSADRRDAMITQLRIAYIPDVLSGSQAAMALIFSASRPERIESGNDWYDRRFTILWFLERAPEACWTELFADQERAIEATGLGRLEFAAPFIPVLTGTDRYVDQLR